MRTPGSHAREGARESKEAGAQERERAKARAHVRTTERAQERERGEKMRMGVGAGVGVGCRVCVRVWVILHSSGGRTKYIKRQGYCIFASVIYASIGPSIFTI